MEFALVHFYKEDSWDVIPSTDLIIEDKNMQKEALVGLKTLVIWRDIKARGKGKETKVPAEILNVSGLCFKISIAVSLDNTYDITGIDEILKSQPNKAIY